MMFLLHDRFDSADSKTIDSLMKNNQVDMIDSVDATCYCLNSARYFLIELSKQKPDSNHCNGREIKYSLTFHL